MKNFKYIILLLSIIFFFCSCNGSSKAEIIGNEKTIKTQEIKKEKKVYTKNDIVIQKVFTDSAKISPKNKYMLIVIGTNTDPYTNKLKEDLNTSLELINNLKENFTSYYLKAHENLRHKLFHEGQYMDVDTKTMISIYQVNSTPTLIFTDKKGKAIIIVPGYMPPKQFLITIEFIKSKKWLGKNRKNGEVYEELRNFYIKNNINVSKKKD